MNNLATTYQYIADILSFESDTPALESTLSQPAFNWDSIVKEGSKHLVLPAIFCRLKAKQLLHVLPEELHIYLEEITNLNRQRNASLLKQVYVLSELFNKHQINHVFLKGAALLASGIYEDNAERMIGDIDILVHLDQIDSAFDLLTRHHFEPMPQTFGSSFFEHKHLPRLTTKQDVAAVELHKKLFVNYREETLENSNVLDKKRIINNISIPLPEHLLRHNILNYQINDKGRLYNSINFRSTFDTLILLKKSTPNLNIHDHSIIKNYFRVIGIFFKEFKIRSGIIPNYKSSFYLFKLKNLGFYRAWNEFLRISDYVIIMIKRIPMVLFNIKYRRQLLADRHRILKHLKHTFRGS